MLADVRNTALDEVFASELADLDGDTRNLVDRIVLYLEKKYISPPMKLAKEVVMDQLDKELTHGRFPHFRIGTRGSDLARWQAHHVRDLIESPRGHLRHPVLSTQGDREQVQAFEKLEGKGFFTKEIEQALLDDTVDLAVHSHKDLETRQPDGTGHRRSAPSGLPRRRPAHPEISQRPPAPWLPLAMGAKVGTSSVRRRDQLLLLRPDLDIQALRGNVPTRVERLRQGLLRCHRPRRSRTRPARARPPWTC